MDLSGVGVWSSQLRYSDPGEAAESAAELEELGFEALWRLRRGRTRRAKTRIVALSSA